jgi:thiol-disulfide isomerase/thioredoxin
MHAKKFILPILFFALAGLACAADHVDEHFPLLRVGNATYTNVTITSVSAADICFIHAGGMENVKIKALTPAMQKHFNFDSKEANAAERKLAENRARYHEQLLQQPAAHPPEMTREPAATTAVAPANVKKIWAKSFLNQKAPDLIVEKWLTAEPNLRGKFVLIDFWATWCPPCRRAIPELNGYHEKFGDKLVVIGISDETEEAVRRLVNPHIKYAVAIDTQARTKNTVQVTGIPHVLIIDPHGVVRWEGFPFLEGYELNEQVVSDILERYSN